ncbi:hypothetical protein MKX29_02975 [Cytobacillus sp. FSL R7-0696]|uniref:hypothetical protein n=1 Tax=Cytobacillus sp. FSL R7-0696 TaxID=2921691 RepID=UPI0030F5E462
MRASSECAQKTKEKWRKLRANSVYAQKTKEKWRKLRAKSVYAQMTKEKGRKLRASSEYAPKSCLYAKITSKVEDAMGINKMYIDSLRVLKGARSTEGFCII